MKEAPVKSDFAFIAHDEAAEVAEPGKGALDFPALSIASQGGSSTFSVESAEGMIKGEG